MKLLYAGRTDVGRARTNNEDSFYAEEPLFMVADGVGGHAAGEVASRMAVQVAGEHTRRAGGGIIGNYDKEYSEAANRLASALRLANKAIYEAANGDPSLAGMASTAAAVLFTNGNMSIAHVGDCRVYLIRAGTINRLTEDHTVVADQQRQGLISEAEAKSSSMRHVVTRALGAAEGVEVTLGELGAMSGDRVFICSDGLTDMVSEDLMLETVSSAATPDAACEALIDAANAGGGRDNITVVVAFVEGGGLLKKLLSVFK